MDTLRLCWRGLASRLFVPLLALLLLRQNTVCAPLLAGICVQNHAHSLPDFALGVDFARACQICKISALRYASYLAGESFKGFLRVLSSLFWPISFVFRRSKSPAMERLLGPHYTQTIVSVLHVMKYARYIVILLAPKGVPVDLQRNTDI